MMINTRSAAAFSITRLRAIQSGKQKSLAQPTFQKENQRTCPARSFGDQSAPVQKSTTRTTLKAAYVGLSSSSIE